MDFVCTLVAKAVFQMACPFAEIVWMQNTRKAVHCSDRTYLCPLAAGNRRQILARYQVRGL